MKPNKTEALSEDFLYELYYCVFKYENVCGAVMQHMKKEYLPDKTFQEIHKAISEYYKTYRTLPTYATIRQKLNGDYDIIELMETIESVEDITNVDAVLDMLEEYIKGVRLQAVYTEVGKLYNQNKRDKAQEMLSEYVKWLESFTLKESSFVDVVKTFSDRFQKNRIRKKESEKSTLLPITRFYVDELDELNQGRSFRKQHTCFLASTGVGKSHIARHIGHRACVDDKLHVLHFQLEGSEEEVLDAYSGALISKNSFLFENGAISDSEFNESSEQITEYSGSITVRSFPRFNNRVSTIDIKNGITEYKKTKGHNPDVVIIDSLDLLDDASGKYTNADQDRKKRIAVANDLKDIAGDENIWVVSTYQATIENRDWLNDEKNVLTEYNCSEAKGLPRPLTHLITLNQSDAERKENTMRLHIAKARFFKKGDTFKIATDYDNEIFYDRKRTMNLQLK